MSSPEKKRIFRLWLMARNLMLICAMLIPTLAHSAKSPTLYYGFTPFPYDATSEAERDTRDIIIPNSNLYALHYDDCVPWGEALSGKPFPSKIMDKWKQDAKWIPSSHTVYVGLAPIAKDRKSLAPACGDMPLSMRWASLDSEDVKQAYLNYARRAIDYFNPQFLNIGIEAGELLSRDEDRWPQLESLLISVMTALKKEHPKVKVGISFGLQSLMKPKHAKTARKLVEASDYLGLSFYPHASSFGEKFGDPALGKGASAWRDALTWVSSYTDKPIAIAETGFTTQNINIKKFDLSMQGDEQLQAKYVKDLLTTAREKGYLFVVWFLAIDYDALYKRMEGTPDNEINLMWRNIGLLDGKQRPKAGWQEWKKFALSDYAAAPVATTSNITEKPKQTSVSTTDSVSDKTTFSLGFSSEKELFDCNPGSVSLRKKAMFWQYEYKGVEWRWCVRNIPIGVLSGSDSLAFQVKSNLGSTLLLQLEERDGEAFFMTIDPGNSWKDIKISLDQLKPDPAKRKNGRLDLDTVVKITLADAAGTSGAKGQRKIWLRNMQFVKN